MSEKNYVYRYGQDAESAYYIDAEVVVELKGGESFTIESKSSSEGIVFGIAEILGDGAGGRRCMSIYTLEGVKASEIPNYELEKDLRDFTKGYKIGQSAAEMVVQMDKIRIRKIEDKEELEDTVNEISKGLAWVTNRLIRKIKTDEKAMSLLSTCYEAQRETLAYELGMRTPLYKKTVDKEEEHIKGDIGEKLDEYGRRILGGNYVCREGDIGDEFYILKEGRLRLSIEGKELKQISESGTILGDMIFWLGANRTASIQAIEDTNIVVIKKQDIPKILKGRQDFLKLLIKRLASYINEHCKEIEELNKEIEELRGSREKIIEELKDFKYKLKEVLESNKEYSWINELVKSLDKKLEEGQTRGGAIETDN